MSWIAAEFCSLKASNISSVVAHWKVHEGNKEKSCEMLRRRHNYLKSVKTSNYWITAITVDELETTKDGAGTLLSIKPLKRGKFIAKRDHEFKGKHYLVDNLVTDRILNGDIDGALASVPELPSGSSFFSPRSSRSSGH